ncbi:hypothetical protein FQN54_008750 [Arachnomyces sp. PD_36]|nr:hypothetical protein FQN54_008750 [Arachnomyces sp. PD_36]
MAKAKSQKGSAGAAQSHLRARITYLHKASAYILSVSSTTTQRTQESSSGDGQSKEQNDSSGDGANPHTTSPTVQTARLPRQYLSQIRGVSLKSQLRLPQDIKRSACRRCDILLIPGSTCTEEIENQSRGKKKPWADVRVVRCTSCGTTKRFPQASKRSSRLSERKREKKENAVPGSTGAT